MQGYIYLTISIIAEVFGTSMLKLSNGFTVLAPSIGVVVGYGIAFYGLSLSLRTMPLSIAYAIWSGAGTALTALIGYLVWDEVFGVVKLLGIALIIGGIIVLNASDAPTGAAEEK
jgi:multidrug resistance protein EbrB